MTMTIPLAPGSHWTVEALQDLPDDGNRYEIFDGSLLVTPPPSVAHGWVQHRLAELLKAAAPADVVALSVGLGVSLQSGTTCYIPDIVVILRRAIERSGLALDPCDVLLVVEVLSPSNRGRDLLLKRHGYAAAAIPNYWIVDPQPKTLTVLTLDPGDSSYREQAVVTAGRPLLITQPFEITLDPADFC